MKKSAKTPLNTLDPRLALSLKLGELSHTVQCAVDNLLLLRDMIDRGESGEPLHLNFNAVGALTLLLSTWADDLAQVGDELASL
jgi:hypothetical protein